MARAKCCSVCQRELPFGVVTCPFCQKVNVSRALPSASTSTARYGDSVAMSTVEVKNNPRISTGPWDRCFGTDYDEEGNEAASGIVVGTANLIAGEPGAGKSTLALTLAAAYAEVLTGDDYVLYLASEEVIALIKARANRLRLKGLDRLRIKNIAGGEIVASEYVRDLPQPPKLVVLDSLDNIGGDIVAETYALRKLCEPPKSVTFILISHVNKGCEIAGEMRLQHNVDATLAFVGLGDKDDTREFMSIKNRNGAAKVACKFEMTEHGLVYIPSEDEEEPLEPLKFGILPDRVLWENRVEWPIQLDGETDDEVVEIGREQGWQTLEAVVTAWKGGDQDALEMVEALLNEGGYTWEVEDDGKKKS